MTIEGRYINLDRSVQRRMHMEQQLQALGLSHRIHRFPGIDGLQQYPEMDPIQAGAYGCFCSHRDLILSSNPDSSLLILEDDVDISADLSHILSEANIGAFVASNPEVDIIFLDCLAYFSAAPMLLKAAEAYMPRPIDPTASVASQRAVPTVNILSAQNIYSAACAAYIITPKGKCKLPALFTSVDENHIDAIDSFYARHIREERLQALLFLPYLATPTLASIHNSTIDQSIEQRWGDPPEMVAGSYALRRLMFAGDCNLPEIEALVAPLLQQYGPSPESLLALQIMDALQRLKASLSNK